MKMGEQQPIFENGHNATVGYDTGMILDGFKAAVAPHVALWPRRSAAQAAR